MSTDTLYDQGYRYLHFDSATSVTVRDSQTRLVRLLINNTAGGGSVVLYDGPTIFSPIIGIFAASAGAHTGSIDLDLVLESGLTVVVNSTPDITLIYS